MLLAELFLDAGCRGADASRVRAASGSDSGSEGKRERGVTGRIRGASPGISEPGACLGADTAGMERDEGARVKRNLCVCLW